MTDYKNLDGLVTSLPLYGTFSIRFSNGENEITQEGLELLKVLFHTNKVVLACGECEDNRPFSVKTRLSMEEEYVNNKYTIHLYGYPSGTLDDERLITYGGQCPDIDNGIIEFTFKCTLDKRHCYKMFLSYSLNNGVLKITKIGQYPSTRTFRNLYSNQFKKILTKYDAVDDYKMYELSVDMNLLAGGCTYLRRIFEKMIEKMIADNNKDVDLSIFEKNLSGKIKLAKQYFDPEIQDILSEVNDLLGKGIHRLSNNEIDKIHSLLADVINIQLEFETERDYRVARLKELRSSVRREYNEKKKK